MSIALRSYRSSIITMRTWIRLYSRMLAFFMALEIRRVSTRIVTLIALIRLLPCVCSHVTGEMAGLRKCRPALLTHIRLLFTVHAHVPGEITL